MPVRGVTALPIHQNRNEQDHKLISTLIKGCKQYDPDSQEMLYKKYYGYAMAIALKYCSKKDDANEVVNDSFMKVFENIQSFEISRPFKPWLRRIIINTSIDKTRKLKRHSNHMEFEDEHGDVKINGETELTVKQIYRLINRLSTMHKFVFNLYEIEGYSHSEIAEMLDIGESSSRTYLFRAKRELRQLYQTYFLENHEEARSE